MLNSVVLSDHNSFISLCIKDRHIHENFKVLHWRVFKSISSIYFRNHVSVGLPLTCWQPMPLKNEFRPYSFLSHSEYYGSMCRICQSYIETNSIHRCLQLWPHSFSRQAFGIYMFISFLGLSVLCPVFLVLEAFLKTAASFLLFSCYILTFLFFGNFKLIHKLVSTNLISHYLYSRIYSLLIVCYESSIGEMGPSSSKYSYLCQDLPLLQLRQHAFALQIS